jgi:hypothetical protein
MEEWRHQVEMCFSHSLTCGTTWHAVGLIGKMRGTSSETQLSNYGTELYKKLEEETGLGTGNSSLVVHSSFFSLAMKTLCCSCDNGVPNDTSPREGKRCTLEKDVH